VFVAKDILVKPLDVEGTVRSELRKMEDNPDPVSKKFPANYDTLCGLIANLFGRSYIDSHAINTLRIFFYNDNKCP